MSAINAARLDPYKNFKFRVKVDGVQVAGVTMLSGLKSPKRDKFEAITLERGVTHDASFLQWAGAGANGPRRDIVVEFDDDAGRLTAAYTVLNCWVSSFQGLPDLDANANAVRIQVMKLENTGWRRNP